MATIDERIMQDGTVAYRVRVKRKGYPQQVASFTKLSDAKKWGQMMEGSIIQGRHFPTTEAKRHTISDLLERYRNDVLPHKGVCAGSVGVQSTIRIQHCFLSRICSTPCLWIPCRSPC